LTNEFRAAARGLRPAYPIETVNLALRPFAAGDLGDLYAYHSRPEVVRYLYWEPCDRAQAREALERRMGQTALDAQGQSLVLAIELRALRRVIGEVRLHWLHQGYRQGEIGFVFNPDFQGRGLATEAAAATLQLGFDGLDLHRIIGRCDVRNHASARVMERLGMRREAHFVHNEIFKGEWGEELWYGILEHEWLERERNAGYDGERRAER
jgi:RimJ/RimL family protein N-acetyltransferase